MCGIAGIAGHPDTALIHAMTDTLAHRGPDGEGHHVDGDIALGHRRLAIIDRAGGAQPMAYGGNRYWTRSQLPGLARRVEGMGMSSRCVPIRRWSSRLTHWGLC